MKFHSFPSIHRKLASTNNSAAQKNTTGSDVWITCFDKRMGDTLQILAGDSEGSMYFFEPPRDWREKNECMFDKMEKVEGISKMGVI